MVGVPIIVEMQPTTEGVMQHSPWPNVMQWGKVKVNDRQHMVEEVKMMQHALQKYKLELRALELRAHSSYSKVQLSKSERDELDCLQMLRQEVLKEVAELEHLLALRMRGIIAGVEQSSTGLTQRNDLAGLNAVHLMIELMKEQVYHGNIVNGMETDRALSPAHAELQLSQEDHDTSMAQTGKTQIVDHLSLLQKQLTAQQNHTTTQLQNTLKEIRSTLLEEIRSSIQVETQQIRFQMQSAEEQLEVLKHRVNSVSQEQSVDLDADQERIVRDFQDPEPDKSSGSQHGTVAQ